MWSSSIVGAALRIRIYIYLYVYIYVKQILVLG
jgi:hypothetical protein